VGIVSVRVLKTTQKHFSFDLSAFNHLKETRVLEASVEPIVAPEILFAEMVFPVERPVPVIARKVPVQAEEDVAQTRPTRHELPFDEFIRLTPVQFNGELLQNLVALYQELPSEEKLLAQLDDVKEDVVSTALASAAEPVFLEYATEEKEIPKTEEKVTKNESINEQVLVAELPTEEMKTEKPIPVTAVENLEDLVAFDYSKAKQDVTTQKVPTVTKTTIVHAPVTMAMARPQIAPVVTESKAQSTPPSTLTTQEKAKTPEPKQEEEGFVSRSKLLSTQTSIQAVGTNLQGNEKLSGFEMLFHDDYSQSLEDSNTGEIALESVPAKDKMNRAIRLLKRGFAPTNADLIIEKDGGSMTVPLVEEEVFNNLQAPFEKHGPTGAVLVELDDETEYAQLDVPFGQVILLDGNLRETTATDNRYQLFVGVRAGNAMLTYRRHDREAATKIVHVHDREVTFDNNFFDSSEVRAIKLFEEDLLSKEKNPLVISSHQVKVFAADRFASKVNDHTYKLELQRSALGGRRHLELLHLAEPVFVGFSEHKVLDIPSENYMRHILSNNNGSLGNRCLVQVNLSRKVMNVTVGSESVEDTLHTIVQMLDRDGKFYDSASDKTHKLIILGESEAGPQLSQEGRINVKIDYADGTNEFFNSYCSPNTYMVEQL
jgi:hypothetical protein